MPPDDPVPGLLEEQVLLALVRSGPDAYGMTVRRELQRRTGRDVSIGAVYATLDRLEAKGWVHSRHEGAAGGARGPRRFFELAESGARALRESRRLRESLWEGLDVEDLLPEG